MTYLSLFRTVRRLWRHRSIDADLPLVITSRERQVDLLAFGGTFAVAAIIWAAAGPPGHPLSVAAPVAVILLVLSARFGLLLEEGWVGCQQAAFVFLVFTVPLNLVPLVAFGCVVVTAPRRREPLSPLLASAANSWYALIASALLALLAPGPASWSNWPAYLAVFSAQFVVPELMWAVRCCLVRQRVMLSELLTVLVVDVALTPSGLAAAVSLHDAPGGAIATVMGTTALLALIDREHRIRRREAERALRDPLTGLANRTLFDEVSAACEARCRRNGQSAALLLIDLDDFKPINDTFGHQAGDEILCQFADAICRGTRAADTPGRLGGDEFAVILAEPIDLDGAERVIADLREQLSRPLTLASGEAVEVGFSVGSALINGETSTAEAIAEADAALYAEKRDKQPEQILPQEASVER